ncbi:DUF6612 family protein [Caldanaerobius polysaccharolyticus]|uniref:DUF6612 family protein n=1 Tax=Caldanaerobius polysaccharolyticus TaxID=44256 RepID=UPI00047BABDB|nr:DUF6612 family protein [Caldanaerobius polysaccharolyticus]
MKKIFLLALVSILLISLPISGLAQTDNSYMTRGEFVNLLIQQAGVDLGGKTVQQYLIDKGILFGDGKGNLGLDRPITYRQIGYILSRFYGLSKMDVHQLSENEKYVYALEEDLLPKYVSLDSKVTSSEGKKIIESLFSKSKEAYEILKKASGIQLSTMRINGGFKIIMGLKDESVIPFDSIDMTFNADMDNTGIYEKIGFNIPQIGDQQVEEYIIGDRIYLKSSEDNQWAYMTVQGLSNLKDANNIQMPDVLNEDTLFRMADNSVIDGKEVYVIDAYTKITDMEKLNEVIKMMGMNNLMNYNDVFESMYGKYTYYIDTTTNNVVRVNMAVKIYTKDGISENGQPVPLKWEMISGSMNCSNINDPDIKVVLPEEAKNARELTIPDLP